MFKLETESSTSTGELGEKISSLLQKGDVILLKGDLGAGKTTFVQGIARGLKIQEQVTSPTFTIVQQYEGEITLNHIDAYRIENSEELPELGLEEIIDGWGITFIEWPEKIESILPQEFLEIQITKEAEDRRLFSFEGIGKHYESLVKELSKIC